MELPTTPIVVRPVLPVVDMQAATAFYETSGFEVELFDEGYGWVRHRGHEILHLRLVETLDVQANPSVAFGPHPVCRPGATRRPRKRPPDRHYGRHARDPTRRAPLRHMAQRRLHHHRMP